MKASDNVFPQVLFEEVATPAAAAAGQVRIYAKSDGLLYSIDDAGVETLVSGGLAAANAITSLTGDVTATGPGAAAATLATVPIAKGGTGQVTQTAGMDALSPTTTKGDLLVDNGSNVIRLAVGSNTQVLTADSGEPSGLKWAAGGGGSGRSGAATDAPASNQDDYNPASADTCAVLELTPTASILITGFNPAADAGERVTITNHSTDFLIGIPHESASSTAAYRFARPQVAAPITFLLPGDSIDIVYTGSRWRIVGHSGEWLLWDDMFGFANQQSSGLHGTTGNGGSNDTTDPGGLDTYAVGVITNRTGTNSNGLAGMVGNAGFRTCTNEQGCALVLTRISIQDLSDGTDTYQVFAGMHSTASSDGEDSISWLYRAGSGGTNSAEFRFGSIKGGVENLTASGVTVTTARWYWLGTFINSDWSQADFFISDDGATWTFVGSETTLPASGARFGVGATIRKLAGTNDRVMYLDCVGLRYDAIRS